MDSQIDAMTMALEIVFCDVERPLKSAFITRLNRSISNNLVKVLASDCFSAGENVARS